MRAALSKTGAPKKTQAKITLPLKSYAFFENRGGEIAKTVQIIERDDGEIVIGIVSDMEEPFAESRAAYRPLCQEISLDFELVTMFATGEGDLLGRAWFDQLKWHDRRITGLAKQLQKQGIRPNQSKRYRARVAAFRGFLKTEIGRVLNRLVALKRPAHIVVEKLDFRAPGLSKRLNRILARSGRSVIRAKLKGLEERFGVSFDEVNPAYSSQTCSACGFVAKANRKSQSEFSRRACGREIHADVNAARNLESGRFAFERSARHTKAKSLELTVHRHLERLKTRGRVASDRAVIVSNPNYRDALERSTAVTPLTAADKSSGPSAPDLMVVRPTQDLVADVSAG
jgi:putative transposase